MSNFNISNKEKLTFLPKKKFERILVTMTFFLQFVKEKK